MDISTTRDSPLGLKAELCLIEVILLMTHRAAKRADGATLANLEDYITQSYLMLGYTETDYIVTIREYIEALHMATQGKDAQAQIDRTQKQIMYDLHEVVVANACELSPLFSVNGDGQVVGLYGQLML